MNDLFQDLRYALRSLRKTPGFAAVAIATLALGIGANTAIFSVVDAVLLRPLPFAEPDRLVQIVQDSEPADSGPSSHSYLDLADYRKANRSFSAIASYRYDSFTLSTAGAPLHVSGSVVSPNLFDVLGVLPRLGSTFDPGDDRPGPRTVVLSDGLWRRLGADPAIAGRSIFVDARPFRVAGVMPPGFQFPIGSRAQELWVNSGIDAERSPESPEEKSQAEQRGWRSLRAVARLRPGVSIARARADTKAIAMALAAAHPDENAHRRGDVLPLHAALVADLRPALVVLFGAVGCVLLIACANIANLLLARAADREREIAVRAAIGASRGRMIRQLLTESLLLSAIGAAAGVVLARWAIDVVVARGPRDLPRLSEIRLDLPVLAFTALLAFVTGIVFGLAPALRAAPARLSESLKEGGRSTASRHGNRLRGTLVIVEVTLASVLLAGAALLVQSFARLARVDPGFDPSHVFSLRFSLPDRTYSRPELTAAFGDAFVRRVAASPGVRSAALIGPLPLGGGAMDTSVDFEDRPLPKSEQPDVDIRIATDGFFRTMGIPILAGRDFGAEDRMDAPPVAIVGRTFARRFFGSANPIGRRIRPGISSRPGDPPWRRIIAVVGDVKRGDLAESEAPEFYLPFSQVPFGSMTLVARALGSPLSVAPAAVAPAAVAAAHAVDPAVALFEGRPVEDYMARAVARPRFNTILLGTFAILALVLTAVGLFGVLSYTVSQRTHEIGIRRALGADDPAVYRLVVGHGMRLAGAGLALGVAGALVATRLLSTLLFGIRPFDLPTFAAVALGLGVVAFAASWLPARRAAGIEPTVALRME